MTKEDFWKEFKSFKKNVPSMRIEDVREQTNKFKYMSAQYYRGDEINKIQQDIVNQVKKVVDTKRKLIINNQTIMGWKMPSSFVPNIKDGEPVEMLPKRIMDAYRAMLNDDGFAVMCSSDINYMREYDKFIIDWCSKYYNIDKNIVIHNMNNVVVILCREIGIDESKYCELVS